MEYQELRTRHVQTLMSMIPEQIDRLTWARERIAQERQSRLRHLLRVAKERSTWHRERLSGIDPESATEETLADIPPMTKADLMANWDAIVTDPRITLALAEQHLAGLTADAYVLDEFHVVASGGSSGQRGVFAFGWDAWALIHLGFSRPSLWQAAHDPADTGRPGLLAVVAADAATHMTSAIGQTFANPLIEVARFPITWPMEKIVAGLNDVQPATLFAYGAALGLLAAEQKAGRLHIEPRRLSSGSEPLLPEVRRAAEDAFGAPVANWYGTSEVGPTAVGCWCGPGLHLCEDLVIVEPVDGNGGPVGPGVLSDRIYVTGLTNPLMPLIRYEVTDQITVLDEPCPCGWTSRKIADIEGRLDDVFLYPGGITVHPFVFRSILGTDPGVAEYQVRQTSDGAEVLLVGRPTDVPAYARGIEKKLAEVGVDAPRVEIHTVATLARQPTGKLARFVRLAG